MGDERDNKVTNILLRFFAVNTYLLNGCGRSSSIACFLTTSSFSEDSLIEKPAIEIFEGLGYEHQNVLWPLYDKISS